VPDDEHSVESPHGGTYLVRVGAPGTEPIGISNAVYTLTALRGFFRRVLGYEVQVWGYDRLGVTHPALSRETFRDRAAASNRRAALVDAIESGYLWWDRWNIQHFGQESDL
jgi:hypothetical protein